MMPNYPEKKLFKCQECGKKFNAPLDWCPRCGSEDIDVNP